MTTDKSIFELFEEIKKALEDKSIPKRVSEQTHIEEAIVKDKIYLSIVTIYKEKLFELLEDIRVWPERVIADIVKGIRNNESLIG